MATGPIEQKAVAGPAVALVAGYLATVLFSAVPWLRDHLTPDQREEIPVIIAFALSALAAYLAPHTHRPDLPPQVTDAVRSLVITPPPATMTTSGGQHERPAS